MTLGAHLRAVRLARGRSLRDLAATLGISPSYLSDIETDRRIPSLRTLRELAAVLGEPVEVLGPLTGRLTDEMAEYIKTHPSAWTLLALLAEHDVNDSVIETLAHRLLETTVKSPGKVK